MKITTFILIISLMQVSAASFGQRVTLKQRGITLEDVFREIRNQTGYDVLVGTNKFQISQKIDANFQDSQLTDVMDKIVKVSGLSYTIEGKTVVIKEKETPSFLDRVMDRFANIDVRGRILDEQNNPLVGATVKVKGTNQNTVTNEKGEFYLQSVNENGILIISFIGYLTKDFKVQKDLGTIKLEQLASDLEEIAINKGYYQTSKELNTGNVSRVTASDIEKQPISDPLMALEGRISGLYVSQTSGVPGSGITVRLRGQNSIANGNNPFYIVDGVPFISNTLALNPSAAGSYNTSPLASIRPEDIESIDVLKDADATAIYGSRGANGVILITTKKGKTGKTKFEANVYSGIGKVTDKLDFMNTEQYLEMRREAFKNDGLTVPNSSTTPDYSNYDLTSWDQSRYTDWQKVLIGGTSRFINASASISGGNLQTQFLLGGSFRRETTVYPGEYNNQLGSANLNINHFSEDKKFHITITANYSINNNKLPLADFTQNIFLAPNAPNLYKSDGELNWENSTWKNPFAQLNQNAQSITNNLITNLAISYNITADLQLKGSFGYNDIKSNDYNVIPFSSFDPATPDPANNRTYRFGNNQIKSWIIEPQLNYHKNIGNHHFDALLGATFQSNQSQSINQNATGFSSDALIENLLSANNISLLSNNYTQYRYDAILARIGYNYNEKYILNLTGRRDGSSRFGPGKQFGNFGAIGAAWIFSKEAFTQSALPFLSFGKIRGSIGTTGNDQLQDYEYLSTYVSNGFSYQGSNGLQPNKLTNPFYSWEIIKKLEFGLDLGFIKDRLLLNGSWYRNRTGNQLVGYPLPAISGFPIVQANLPAVIENSGFEFEVNTINIRSDKFHWTSSINISIPKNKLISYPNLEGSPYASQYVIGQPLFIRFMYQYKGLDQQTGIYTFEDLNGDGAITSLSDRKPEFVGQKYFGGINNTLSYKGFSLDIFVQFVKQTGYNFTNNVSPGLFLEGGVNQPTTILRRWQKQGDLGPYQKYSQDYTEVFDANYTYYNYSNARISDASFIRLKNIMLAYNLSDNLLKKAKVRNVKIFVQGQNLFTITNFKGLDPESQSSADTPLLPPLKILTAGLQIGL